MYNLKSRVEYVAKLPIRQLKQQAYNIAEDYNLTVREVLQLILNERAKYK